MQGTRNKKRPSRAVPRPEGRTTLGEGPARAAAPDDGADRVRTSREVVEALVAIANGFAQRADRRLLPEGLSWPQFQILRTLREAGPEGLLVHEVARSMGTGTPNITRLVDKLEAKGLVTRARSEEDRRTVRLGLTNLARGRLCDLESPVAAEVGRTVDRLCEEELARLHALLGRLSHGPPPGSPRDGAVVTQPTNPRT